MCYFHYHAALHWQPVNFQSLNDSTLHFTVPSSNIGLIHPYMFEPDSQEEDALLARADASEWSVSVTLCPPPASHQDWFFKEEFIWLHAVIGRLQNEMRRSSIMMSYCLVIYECCSTSKTPPGLVDRVKKKTDFHQRVGLPEGSHSVLVKERV